MRNYRAGLGKWQTADPMGYPDGWNQLAYCGNGVTANVDRLGLFDQAWDVIFGHWLRGSGAELDIFYDEYFSGYMKANAILDSQIERWLSEYASGYDVGLINIQKHAVIDNGYTTGYGLLHGSDGTVGDFQMSGGFRLVQTNGNESIYRVELVCQWNDIINANYSYDSDVLLEIMIRLFGYPYPYFSPADYVIRIRWKVEYELKVPYE